MLRILVVALLVAVASVVATDFDKCDGSDLPPTTLTVVGCDKQPCNFIRGQQIEADVAFQIDHAVNQLTPEVMATVLGVTINFPLPEKNGCNSITNSECPLYAGEKINYRLKLPILQTYPKVDFLVQLSLLDQNNESLVCFKVQGKVSD